MQSGAVITFVGMLDGFKGVAAFVIGIFYTSMLTTAPAIVGFAELTSTMPLWKIALYGSLGAVAAEVLMFRFICSPLVEDLMRAAFHPKARRFGRMFSSGPLIWVGPIAGAIVIGSPLPDELGLLMLGLSHIRVTQFIPLALAGNAVGIYIIASIAASVH